MDCPLSLTLLQCFLPRKSMAAWSQSFLDALQSTGAGFQSSRLQLNPEETEMKPVVRGKSFKELPQPHQAIKASVPSRSLASAVLLDTQLVPGAKKGTFVHYCQAHCTQLLGEGSLSSQCTLSWPNGMQQPL